MFTPSPEYPSIRNPALLRFDVQDSKIGVNLKNKALKPFTTNNSSTIRIYLAMPPRNNSIREIQSPPD
ncbi:MAG: hypothetical protein WA364_06525 [Candidatus Nitrosopolaris sp.]